MALIHIPFDRIEQSHLQALIEAKAAESRYVDYKSATYGNNDSARAEFLADISSFANALGGDLVIGIEAANGVPTNLVPFVGDSDQEILRLEGMIRAGLEPRILNLRSKPIFLQGGGSALLFRVPRSYNQPHRVIFQERNRFWTRSSAGKYEPNVDELRAMFNQLPELAERMRQLRTERLQRISAGNAPTPLLDQICLVHIDDFGDRDGAVADRDPLCLNEIILEEVPESNQSCATMLRPMLDHLANAAGRASALGFDRSGTYVFGVRGR